MEERKDRVTHSRNPNTDAEKSDTQPVIDSVDTGPLQAAQLLHPSTAHKISHEVHIFTPWPIPPAVSRRRRAFMALTVSNSYVNKAN